MLFSEVYGSYYHAVASIPDAAVKEPISEKEIRRIADEKAFGESFIMISEALSPSVLSKQDKTEDREQRKKKDKGQDKKENQEQGKKKYKKHEKKGQWELLNQDGRAVIHSETHMPLTILEKRRLKALLADPRIALFQPSAKGLEDVEPLFHPEDIVFFDQYADGDPYKEEQYIQNFRMLLSAVKSKSCVKVLYQLRNGNEKWLRCHPVRMEYSLRDDKFRLIYTSKSGVHTIKLSNIVVCEVCGSFAGEEMNEKLRDQRVVELLLKDERQALNRVMMQFSIYKKETVKINQDTYRFILTYEAEDEIDLMIRILSFGPNLKVVGPERFVNQIKHRLEMQKRCKICT